MIVRNLKNMEGTDRQVSADTWTSRRLLLRGDNMGFSLHDTLIFAGTSTTMHYQNHLEAVYCIEGQGKLINLETGEEHTVEPGMVYALDQHDRHTLVAETQLRMICVFNPPLVGPESHDGNGAYPLLESEPAGS